MSGAFAAPGPAPPAQPTTRGPLRAPGSDVHTVSRLTDPGSTSTVAGSQPVVRPRRTYAAAPRVSSASWSAASWSFESEVSITWPPYSPKGPAGGACGGQRGLMELHLPAG